MSNTMNYRGYTASVVFDANDKIIVGRVMDIDDIITLHGESVGEFEANFHAVIDDYIAACEQTGAAPEKPASGKLMLRGAPTDPESPARAQAVAGARCTRMGVALNFCAACHMS